MSVPRTRRAPASKSSDMASVRPAKADMTGPLEQYPDRPVPLPADVRADAARYMRRKGHDDLIDMLGLSEVTA